MDRKDLQAYQKMTPEQLLEYLAFKRRGGSVPAKKGKGSYNRNKIKKEW